MITTTAKCDAPDCDEPPVGTQPGEWPDWFIVIELKRARDSINWPTGTYGFCGTICLGRWSRGRPL